MNGIRHDLRLALRQLRKSPAFASIAVATLALGIGASTAMFGVLNAILALAGIGVYGVVSYVVAQRTSEIGVRMALGAQRADVLWLVIQQGIGMAGAGAAAGLVGAWAFRRAVAQLVFGISLADPLIFVAAALLVGVAAFACLVPAARATKVDPMVALRYE